VSLTLLNQAELLLKHTQTHQPKQNQLREKELELETLKFKLAAVAQRKQKLKKLVKRFTGIQHIYLN